MNRLGKTFFVVGFFSMVAMALGVVHLMLPPFWGNPGISAKVGYLQRNGDTFGRLFIGSSHIYRQLSPALFDSSMKDGTKSFNLGFASTFSPEGELICEAILKDTHIKVNEVYVEISPFLVFKEPQLKSCRFWYMVTPSVWWSAMNHALGISGIPLLERLGYAKSATVAFSKAVFLPGLVSQWEGRDLQPEEIVFGPQGDGYMPLELEYQVAPTKGMRERQASLASDTMILSNRSIQIQSLYTSSVDTEESRVHLSILDRLIKLGDERGVKVSFVLPPLSTSPGPLAVFRGLPVSRRIDLNDPTKYPEFYVTANAFDKGHLNTRGSRLFTVAFANEVKRMREAGELRH